MKKPYTTQMHVSHDCKDYAIGETIELTDEQAGPLLAVAAIAAHKPAKAVEKTGEKDASKDAVPAAPKPKKRGGRKADK